MRTPRSNTGACKCNASQGRLLRAMPEASCTQLPEGLAWKKLVCGRTFCRPASRAGKKGPNRSFRQHAAFLEPASKEVSSALKSRAPLGQLLTELLSTDVRGHWGVTSGGQTWNARWACKLCPKSVARRRPRNRMWRVGRNYASYVAQAMLCPHTTSWQGL